MLIRKWTMCGGSLLAALTLAFAGCSQQSDSRTATPDTQTSAASGHTHDEWWCAEHGVPEAKCGLCSPKLMAEFKAKGDWCREHDCPDSQCFVCHPEREKEFAAEYEAKYGQAPPPREQHEDHDDDHDHGAQT